MRNLLSFTDEALYIRFRLGHSQANVIANFAIFTFSFDAHKIQRPEFAKIGCGKLSQDHGVLVAEDRI